jgi:hypothetical protein
MTRIMGTGPTLMTTAADDPPTFTRDRPPALATRLWGGGGWQGGARGAGTTFVWHGYTLARARDPGV